MLETLPKQFVEQSDEQNKHTLHVNGVGPLVSGLATLTTADWCVMLETLSKQFVEQSDEICVCMSGVCFCVIGILQVHQVQKRQHSTWNTSHTLKRETNTLNKFVIWVRFSGAMFCDVWHSD